jgi:hypothetical protein
VSRDPSPTPGDDRPDDLSAALELWAEDARRVAGTIDPENAARAALDAAVDEQALRSLYRRYVAAAVLLFSLGAGGSLWIQTRTGDRRAEMQTMHALEAERGELMGRRLLSSYAGGWDDDRGE